MQSSKSSLILLCLILVNIFVLVGIQGNSFNLNQGFASRGEDFTRKLDERLQSFLNSMDNDKTPSIQIIINFQNITIMTKGIAKINSLSSKIQFLRGWQFIPAAVFRIPIAYIEEIASFPEVRKIWLDTGFFIENFQGKSPDRAQISSLEHQYENIPITAQDTENYAEAYNGSNVVVALLDTGVDIFLFI